MPQPEGDSIEATVIFLVANFGSSALLQACVCGHEALLANNIDRCQFWRRVIDRLERSGGALSPDDWYPG
jgi:hypothetical protein